MAQSVTFERFRAAHVAAVDAGLVAAAYVYRSAVMRKLTHGYTSGLYVTGNVLNSVTVSPIRTVEGVRRIAVGTNVPYAAYWEFGFHPAGRSRKSGGQWVGVREWRVPYWQESLDENRDQMRAAFNRAYWAKLQAA